MGTLTTKVSSRGQVVIPASVRRRLNITPGQELVVEVGSASRGTIILRARSRAEIERQVEKGYEWFKRTGRDLVEELHEARRRESSLERRRRP